jgi:hypothetical protein
MRIRSPLLFLLTASICWAVQALTQITYKLDERLESSRYPLAFQKGQLAGSGAPILTSALAQAQCILVGEDHGIALICCLREEHGSD